MRSKIGVKVVTSSERKITYPFQTAKLVLDRVIFKRLLITNLSRIGFTLSVMV